MRRGLEGWVKPTTGFKKPRAAKMGHFGRWDLQQWDALGPLLHSWEDRLSGDASEEKRPNRPASPHRAPKCVQAAKPLTRNACIQLNKGVCWGVMEAR
jgi:hypothetical protein